MPILNYPRTSHGRGVTSAVGGCVACSVGAASAVGLAAIVGATTVLTCSVASAAATGLQAGVSSSSIDYAAAWAADSSAARGVIYATNFSEFADAAAFYNSNACYGANKNPSMGATFTNAFAITTNPAEVVGNGKGLVLYYGKNGYGTTGAIDNQYCGIPFNGDKTNLAGAWRKKIYIRRTTWVGSFFDYWWKLPGGIAGSPKVAIVSWHGGTADEGEVVLTNQYNKGFITTYRYTTTGETGALIERTRSGTGLSGSPDYQWQNAVDRGTPASPGTATQWKQRYGPFNYTIGGGSSQGATLTSQGNPDPDCAVAGVPWNLYGHTVTLTEIDLAADRVRVWAAPLGGDPKLINDTALDDTTGGAALLGTRVKTGGVGWNTDWPSNLIYSGGGATWEDNPGAPADAKTVYSELVYSDYYVDFHGGKTPPGISSLAQLARSMSSGDWATFTMGGMGLSLLDAGSGHSVTEYASRGHWDPVHKLIQFWGQGHNANTKLLTWDDATNQWTATSDVPYAYGGANIGHAYYHLALNSANGDLYLRRYGSGTIHKKPYGGAWTTVTSSGNLYNQVAGGLEWFPLINGSAGGLVFIDVGSAQSSNAAVSSWTTRQDPLSPLLGNYHNWIAKAGNYCYFGGGLGSTTMFKMDASGTVTSAPSTPIAAGISEGIVMSHPNGSDLLMFAQGTTGNIYRFSGGSWSGSIGTHQIGGATNTWFGVPISDYGVVLFVAQTSNVSEPTVKVYKV